VVDAVQRDVDAQQEQLDTVQQLSDAFQDWVGWAESAHLLTEQQARAILGPAGLAPAFERLAAAARDYGASVQNLPAVPLAAPGGGGGETRNYTIDLRGAQVYGVDDLERIIITAVERADREGSLRLVGR
jgi:hypothetical protein